MPIYEWWLRLINGPSQASFTLCNSAALLFMIVSFCKTKWQELTDALWKDLLPNTATPSPPNHWWLTGSSGR